MADVKKYIKKSVVYAIYIFFIVVFMISQSICVHAQEMSSKNEKIGVYFTLPSGFSYTVNAYTKPVSEDVMQEYEGYTDTAYILTLPSFLKNSCVEFIAYDAVAYFDNTEVYDGDKIILPSGTGCVLINEEKCIFEVVYTADIPQIYIDTQSGTLDYIHENKENREEADITVIEDNEIEYAGKLEYIKGRGNTSWKEEQKPYSIKLQSKASLFGMEVSKKYNLIAPGIDSTFIKNKIIYDFADRIGVEFCMRSQFVDLYCNNEYMGLYLLTEKVEVDESRVDILDLDAVNEQTNPGVNFEECDIIEESYETSSAVGVGGHRYYDIPNDIAENINGGYLLELDFYQRYKYHWIETGFITDYGQTIVINSPQYISDLQMKYIKNYYQQFEDAVLSVDGYNSLGKYYTEYIDIQAAAKMYLIQEFSQNVDAGISSCFMYKDINEKLVMCTPWDFDRALKYEEIRDGIDLKNADNIWLANRILDGKEVNLQGREPTYAVFSLLWMHDDFRQEVVNQWENVFVPQMEWLLQTNSSMIADIYDSAVAEESRWWQHSYAAQTSANRAYQAKIDELEDFIDERTEFLDTFFISNGTGVFYSGNGGEGVVIDPMLYTAGAETTVMENKYSNSEFAFIGWNTQPDGSGEWYYPGDSLKIASENIYLFAQWDGYSSDYVYRQPPVKNRTLLEILVEFFDKVI